VDVDADADDAVADAGVDPPGPVGPAAPVVPVVPDDDPDEAPAGTAAVEAAQVKVGRGSCMSIVPAAVPLGRTVEVWKIETKLAFYEGRAMVREIIMGKLTGEYKERHSYGHS